MRHNLAVLGAFAEIKVTNHTGQWDAKLVWYSPSATCWICFSDLTTVLEFMILGLPDLAHFSWFLQTKWNFLNYLAYVLLLTVFAAAGLSCPLLRCIKVKIFMLPCLTLSNIRYVSKVEWINPVKGVVPTPTPWCSSYWKGSLLVAHFTLLFKLAEIFLEDFNLYLPLDRTFWHPWSMGNWKLNA